MSLTVEEIVSAAKALPAEEQARVVAALNAGAALPKATDADAARLMAKKGITLPRLPKGDEPEWHKNFRPVKVEGKPVSETIIEERI